MPSYISVFFTKAYEIFFTIRYLSGMNSVEVVNANPNKHTIPNKTILKTKNLSGGWNFKIYANKLSKVWE